MRLERGFESISIKEAAARLGERIRRARKARNLTLSGLESICRVHRTTIGRLERGDTGVTLYVFLIVLESLQELSDVELILSQPETPKHKRKVSEPVLDRDF